ncbi:MAG: DUF2254 domain-containing protein [Allosphingosinicella sp.]
MRVDILKAAQAVRTSYWFIPSLMALAAILLGALMVWVDAGPGAHLLDGVGWYQSVKAEGAHAVLSTIAGSMITVAGVVFSITIVAISYASSQYGPRVLTNFLTDRGNKVTLGTFIATFLYCIVVLRTIRGGDEGAFVPQLAVLTGLLLAVCSIGVLIYFIHHVPQSIHVNNLIAHIGRQLIEGVGQRFPVTVGEPAGAVQAADPSSEAVEGLTARDGGRLRVAAVTARATGYIQAIDEAGLIDAARRSDLVLRLRHRPGDFLAAGRTLVEAWPAERLDEHAATALRDAYSTGRRRTPHGDLDFLVNELAEIATRALSTGVNDPTTAKTCLDWLGAAATEIAGRRLPDWRRTDEDGKVRVLALPDDFAEYMERSFGQLRQYLAGDVNAALHALRTLGEVAAGCSEPAQIAVLTKEAACLAEAAANALAEPERGRVEARAKSLALLLSAGPQGIAERQAEWLGGTA